MGRRIDPRTEDGEYGTAQDGLATPFGNLPWHTPKNSWTILCGLRGRAASPFGLALAATFACRRAGM